MATRSVRQDRFTIWPIALACCFPLILLIDLVPLVVALVVFIIWACSALLALGIAIFSASVGQWRRAVSMAVLPLVKLVLIANAGTVGPLATEMRYRIHFHAMRRNYLEDVSKLPSSGELRFAVWDWGPLEPGGLTLLTRGLELHNEVVYDESDEIALPLQERSSTWKKRMADPSVGSCGVLESLGNHFYLVRHGSDPFTGGTSWPGRTTEAALVTNLGLLSIRACRPNRRDRGGLRTCRRFVYPTRSPRARELKNSLKAHGL
jgi:hypothetical protein